MVDVRSGPVRLDRWHFDDGPGLLRLHERFHVVEQCVDELHALVDVLGGPVRRDRRDGDE